jgi:MFS transporter, ACS family, hexuronate transporter
VNIVTPSSAPSRSRATPLPDSDLQVLSRFTRVRAWTLTGLATLALAITLIHRQVLAALAVSVTTALNISDVRYGWLSSGLAGAFMIGSLPGARLVQKTGPKVGLALTVALTSIVIGLHSVVYTYSALLCLRIGMGLAASIAMPAATQTVHRVLPFKDRSRGIGLLYLGNSVGSAFCPLLAVTIESRVGWRGAFSWIALFGVLWLMAWGIAASIGQKSQKQADLEPGAVTPVAARPNVLELARIPGVLRGSLLVAAAAPVTLVMLIWAAKYLVTEHHVPQRDLGLYLWLPALMFGLGSLMYGELRARSTKTRATARPPKALVAQAACLCMAMTLVPMMYGPGACILVASVAMLGAGGLYTLATSDMLAHTPRPLVASTAGMTTVAQSLIYIVASPILGKCVQISGHYHWVMIGAGLWVLPWTLLWLADVSPLRHHSAH